MRNREVIEREMYRAREDLEASIGELKHIVQEKVDVKARARVAIERGKDQAALAFERGVEQAKQTAGELYAKAKESAADLYAKAKERPAVSGAIVGGIVGAAAMAYVIYRKNS